ncbi:MAG: hypothetical protein GPW18_05950 [Euryarchaeota archaeon]|nr:hypothetical protein [Euryarchaeota archaeon]
MNLCNYLYNVSLLELFIEMGHWKIRIDNDYLSFWAQIGPDYSIGFDKQGISHDFSFHFVFARYHPAVIDTIRYNRDMKKMKLIWCP